MRNTFYIILLVIFTSCVSEPEIPIQPDINNIGKFEIKTVSATRHSLYLNWTAANNALTYDVLINDTMSIKNLKTLYCSIDGLHADASYKITIRAVNGKFNTKTIIQEFRTLRESTNEIIPLGVDKYEFSDFRFFKCEKTNDGGYVYIGNVTKYGTSYLSILKTNFNNTLIWHTELNQGLDDLTTNLGVKVLSNGEYMIVTKYKVFKISTNGILLWTNADLANQTIHVLSSGVQLSDGSFLIAGTSLLSKQMYLLMKISPEGKTLWMKNAGSSTLNAGDKIARSTNGTNFIMGRAESIVGSSTKILNISLAGFTDEGNIVNEKIFNLTNEAWGKNILATSDNSLYIVGDCVSQLGWSETYILKLDNEGNVLWTRRGHKDNNEDYGNIVSSCVLNNNFLIILVDVSYGYIIQEFSPTGELIKSTRVGDFSAPPIYIDKDETGRYVFITIEGYIFKIEPD